MQGETTTMILQARCRAAQSQQPIEGYQSILEAIEEIREDEEDLDGVGYGYFFFVKKWLQKFKVSEEIRPFIDTQFGFQSLEVNGRPMIEQGTGISQIVYILLSVALNPEKDKIFLNLLVEVQKLCFLSINVSGIHIRIDR